MDLEEIGINARNWVDSAQDRNYWRALVNAALDVILRSHILQHCERSLINKESVDKRGCFRNKRNCLG